MVELAMNQNSCSKIKLFMLTIAWTCTIFPTYLQNYSNAISLPITLKALSITDVSHVSRRSANLLNRCPTQYQVGFFKGQDKAPTYFPTCFTLFGFNRKARSLFGWAIYTMLSFLKAPQTSKYHIFQPFATVPQNQLMHISPTKFFLCNAPLSGISWAVFLPKTGVLTSRQILKQIWFDSSSFWHSWSPKNHTACHIDGCAK